MMKTRIKGVISVFVLLLIICISLPDGALASYYGLDLNKTSVIMAKGESITLEDTSGSDGTITWKSSSPSVATVNGKGKIKAKKTGRATITAWLNGVEKSCTVTVKSSKKKAALANYKAFLEQDRISWGPDDYEGSILTSHCAFQLIYIDNNSVPELVLDSRNNDENDTVFHSTGYSQIYCYRNGTIYHLSSGDRHQYYPKKGVFVSVYANHGWKSKSYY